ncbi:MAG TPA: LptE family protein [Thermoanaerobaculia bacterium]|jgi:hypothetical protein
MRRTSTLTLPTLASKLGAVMLSAVILSGCGYALVGRASNIPEDVKKIYVQPLENATARSQVEQILTRSISDELLTRRRFETVNSAGEADAILSGTVLSFVVRPVTFDQDGLANSFEVVISADMKFQRRPTGEEEADVIWSNSRYVFRQDYPLEEGETAYFDRENIAIEDTSEEFARTLVTDLLEGF